MTPDLVAVEEEVSLVCERQRHLLHVRADRSGISVRSRDHDVEAEAVLAALSRRRSPCCVRVAAGILELAQRSPSARVLEWVRVGVYSSGQRAAWSDVLARTPRAVAGWRALGERTPRSVAAWVRQGITTASRASAWLAVGLADPLAVRAWRDAGAVTPSSVGAWIAAGVRTPDELARWRRLVRGPASIARWSAAGVDAGSAVHWAAAGVRTPADLQAWREAGASAKDAAEWHRAGIPPARVADWLRAGAWSAAQARRWRRNGARTPADVSAWLQRHVGCGDVEAWHEIGCRAASDLDRWDAAGLLREALEWQLVGGPDDVLEWKRLGVDHARDAYRWTTLAGFVWRGEIEVWRAAGVHTIEAAERLTGAHRVPRRVVHARRRMADELGIDGTGIGGVPDAVDLLDGDRPGTPAEVHRYHYRADWRRVRPQFADRVVLVFYDCEGDEIPDLGRWEWVSR